MKMKPCMWLLVVTAFIGLGAAAALHAQEAQDSKPHAFYISEFVVTDREGMKPYSAQVESTFRPFGGRYIVRGGKIDPLEGEGPKGGMVVIEFDSRERAQAWYDSPAYRALKPIRHRSATSRVYIVEGTVVPAAPVVSGNASSNTAGMVIARAGSQASAKGPAQNFTGSVRIDPLFGVRAPSAMSGGAVTFEPGARSAWHTHPMGQVLIVTAGAGRIQQWGGGVVEQIRPGDVIWTPPGVKHWHGATPTTPVMHIALQESVDGKNVEWMEKVGDEQYGK